MSFLQFFGSALQVTPHFHSLVPDGVCVPREGGVDRRVPQGAQAASPPAWHTARTTPVSGPPRPLCSCPPPSTESLSVLCAGARTRGCLPR
ncbi:hypothetical protein [Myxococcus sp. CA018]|uniref:hypothetical protein n=1 Tax=Myxococcus sp. CA018 TaxID=2651864 RepID=UPI0034CFD867